MQALAAIDAELEKPQEPVETLRAAVAEIGSTHHARQSSSGRDFSAVALTRQDAVGAWPAYACFLNDTTREKIAKIYAVDLDRYAAFL